MLTMRIQIQKLNQEKWKFRNQYIYILKTHYGRDEW